MPQPALANDAALAVARRLTEAFDSRDASAFEALYAPDATVWHSYDQVEMDRAKALVGVARFFGGLARLRCSDVRREPTPSGFVQQHRLGGEFSAGGSFSDLPVCLIVRVVGDQIARIEEYIDPKGFAPPRA